MKAIILLFLIGFSLSYNRDKAISYAKRFCKNYNTRFNNYKGKWGESSNFISQCLIAGGMTLSNCATADDKGCVFDSNTLRACLSKKGWRHTKTRPFVFKAGDIIFKGTKVFFASYVNGNTIRVYAHDEDLCDENIDTTDVMYFY